MLPPSFRPPLPRLLSLVWRLVLLLPGLLVGVASWHSDAAPNYAVTRDFVIRSWQSADGLPENSVTAIVQPDDGSLWFGTFNGLIRFDGSEFELVADAEAGLPPDTGVLALLLAKDGRIWAGTSRGIRVVANGRVLKGVGQADWPAGELVRSWTETPEGLVAATFTGLCLRFRNERWESLPAPAPDHNGFHLQTDGKNQLWAVKYPQVFRWTGTAWAALAGAGPQGTMGLCRRADGGIWLLADDGLWRGDGEQFVRERAYPHTGFPFWGMAEDSQRRIWITGYRDGLRVFGPDGQTHILGHTNGLSSESIRVTFEDRQGNLWIGTSGGGVMRFRDRRFEMLAADSGLGELAVNSLRWGRDGRLVATTQGMGAYVLRNGQFSPWDDAQARAEFRFAHGTLEEPDGTLWLASDSGVFRRRDGEWEPLHHPQFVAGGQNSLHLDRLGRVWIGCVNGLAVWRNRQLEFLPAPMAGTSFVHFVDDPAGGVFVSSSQHGLWHLDEQDRWLRIAPEALGEQGIHALHWADGALWAATSGLGLARWQDRTLSFVPLPGVDRTAAILSLMDDGQGTLWLACRRGLISLPLTEARAVAAGEKPSPDAQVFGLDDGLVSLEFRRNHQPSAVRSPDGQLWFATLAGVLRFDPARLARSERPPALRLRYLRYLVPTSTNLHSAQQTVLEFDAPVRLPSGSSFLEFAYAGFNFSAPENLRYRFRLLPDDNLNVPWREVEGRRIAYFPVLPSGNYRFQVTAARMGERWNPAPAEVQFEIPQRWWEQRRVRISASLVAAALFTSGVWLLLNVRVRAERQRLQREKVLLDQRLATEEQNQLLRELLDQSADSVFVFELPEGRLIDASASATRGLGRPVSELPAFRPRELGLLPPGKTWEQLVAMLGTETRVRFETRLRSPAGLVPVEVDARLSRHDGRDFVLAIARDISERQVAEERQQSLERQLREAQKLEAIGRLAGGIAHDFNNLLQIIRGFTDLVRMDASMPAKNRDESLAEVSRAAARAADLTRQLLSFSRREAVEMARCNLATVVAESVNMLRPLVGAHIQVHFEAPPSLPPILADQGQLSQVLLNLAANARDAMPGGGEIRLRVRAVERQVATLETAPWASPGHWIELTFSDTGTGIPDDRLARIFEPFFTTKERGKGTGLGLSVVYGVVQQHRALIEVESTPATGTTFRLLFPVCAAPVGEPGPAPVLAGAAERSGTFTILAVDDEETVLQLAERVLGGAGHRVSACTEGRRAVEAFAANPAGFDLVVLDVLMPGMTGWIVARELRRLRPTIPILFCSGYATDEVEREIAVLHHARLLLKPFTPTQLLVEVQLLASQHRRAGRIA